jgi:hypothetical protein
LIIHESASLYIFYKKLSDKFNWDNINIRKNEVFNNNKQFWACYIEIKNQKQYDLGDVIIELRYLEVDGDPTWFQDKNDVDYEKPRLGQTSELGHSGHSSSIKKNERCDLILLDSSKEDREYFIPVYTGHHYREGNISEYKVKSDKITIRKYAKGEVRILAKIDNQSILGDLIYNFSINLENLNPKIWIKKGNIATYLHPKP